MFVRKYEYFEKERCINCQNWTRKGHSMGWCSVLGKLKRFKDGCGHWFRRKENGEGEV